MSGCGAEHRGAGYHPHKDYQPAVTPEQLEDIVGSSLTTLVEAIQTGNTERLTSYLAFSSRFHRYSSRNQQLIYEQCPEATRVASYQGWKKEGYQVRKLDKAKGEQGIRILVPQFPKGYKQGETKKSVDEEGGCKIDCVSGQPEEQMKKKLEGETDDHSTRSDRRTAPGMRRPT